MISIKPTLEHILCIPFDIETVYPRHVHYSTILNEALTCNFDILSCTDRDAVTCKAHDASSVLLAPVTAGDTRITVKYKIEVE